MSGTTGVLLGLSDETIELLRELRCLNLDSAKGFEECAKLVSDSTLKSAFEEISHTRRKYAHVLGTQIEWNDETPSSDGSYLAALHRAWIGVKNAWTTDNKSAVLTEAERGEDAIRNAYEKAIGDTVGSPINDELVVQFNSVRTIHDRIRELQDAQQN